MQHLIELIGLARNHIILYLVLTLSMTVLIMYYVVIN